MSAAQVDLVREELRELGGRVVSAAGRPAEPFGVYAFPAHAPESELARHVEREVFGEFFNNSPELLAAEYGPYEDSTVFLCVLDHRRRLPAGVIRLVLPSPAGLKSLADVESVWGHRLNDVLARTHLTLEADRVWDIATLAVDSEYRGRATDGLVSLALYQSVAQAALRCNVGWVVTILDLVVLDLIQQITSRAFQRFAGLEPRPYLDSPASLPVYGEADAYFARLETEDPSMYEILFEGRGLEAAVRPVDWEPVLAELLPGDRAHTA
jgi:ribosomal protein S18 acetylase RimI-like enzyme